MAKKSSKLDLIFIVVLALGVLAIVSMFLPFVKYYLEANENNYTKTLFNGFVVAFGGEKIASTVATSIGSSTTNIASTKLVAIDLIAFILTVLGLLAVVGQIFVDKKIVKYCKVIAAGLFVVAGVLAFFSLGSFFTANEISSELLQKPYSLGVGAIIYAILNILAGCGNVCSLLKK